MPSQWPALVSIRNFGNLQYRQVSACDPDPVGLYSSVGRACRKRTVMSSTPTPRFSKLQLSSYRNDEIFLPCRIWRFPREAFRNNASRRADRLAKCSESQARRKYHHSHFASRYKVGCCEHVGLFAKRFDSHTRREPDRERLLSQCCFRCSALRSRAARDNFNTLREKWPGALGGPSYQTPVR